MSIDGLSDSDCQQGRLSECKSLLDCVYSDEFFVPLLGDMDEPRNTRNRRKKFLPCLSVYSVVAKEKNHGMHGTDGKGFFRVLFGESAVSFKTIHRNKTVWKTLSRVRNNHNYKV